MKAGWVSPREYVFARWCFSVTWMGPIRHVRIFGFYVNFSRRLR